jgi:23S rRNA (uracil1939-C5)-methyltransferase
MSELATVTIESIGAGGDGIARHNNMVVFVPRAIPGDVVEVTLARHRNFSRGTIERVVTSSPARVDAPCVHFTRDRCGGCQLQGIAYDAQRAIKAGVIRDALVRIGKREVAAVNVAPSPLEWRYRNSLTLTVRRDRLRPSGWVAGMHVASAPETLFELVECHLAMPEVMEGWRALLPHARTLPRSAELRVTLRMMSAGGLALIVEGGSEWKAAAIAELADAVPAIAAIWWVRDDESRALRLDRRATTEPGASFAQVNPAMAAVLREHVLAQVNAVSPPSVIDAYAGSGALSVALAGPERAVTAIELDHDASAYAGHLLRSHANARVLTGRVEALLPHALPAELVILNPPRAGVDVAVPTLLSAADSGVRRVIYISCDPATLARDVARLGDAWTLSAVQAFDMFPQTAHVETVCTLDREVA